MVVKHVRVLGHCLIVSLCHRFAYVMLYVFDAAGRFSPMYMLAVMICKTMHTLPISPLVCI